MIHRLNTPSFGGLSASVGDPPPPPPVHPPLLELREHVTHPVTQEDESLVLLVQDTAYMLSMQNTVIHRQDSVGRG
jgi:hypothetical protein